MKFRMAIKRHSQAPTPAVWIDSPKPSQISFTGEPQDSLPSIRRGPTVGALPCGEPRGRRASVSPARPWSRTASSGALPRSEFRRRQASESPRWPPPRAGWPSLARAAAAGALPCRKPRRRRASVCPARPWLRARKDEPWDLLPSTRRGAAVPAWLQHPGPRPPSRQKANTTELHRQRHTARKDEPQGSADIKPARPSCRGAAVQKASRASGIGEPGPAMAQNCLFWCAVALRVSKTPGI